MTYSNPLLCAAVLVTVAGGIATGASGDAGSLRWSPPKLVNPVTMVLTSSDSTAPIILDKATDYILQCDPAAGGRIVRKVIQIQGGHNVSIVGCHIQRTPNTPASAYPPVPPVRNGKCARLPNPGRLFSITRQTGWMYVEGALFDLQNSTTNYQNYGVDGLELGGGNAWGFASVEGSASPGDVVGFTFSNPQIEGFPHAVNYTVRAGDTPASIAAGIAAAVNADLALTSAGLAAEAVTAPPPGIAPHVDISIPFRNALDPKPDAQETRIAALVSGRATEVFKFNNPAGQLYGAKYVFQNVRVQNSWGTYCGDHADAVQDVGASGRMYFYNVTFTGGYDAVQLEPQFVMQDVQLVNVNARYLDPDYSHKDIYGINSAGANSQIWFMGSGSYRVHPIDRYTIENSYAEARENFQGQSWASASVQPSSNPSSSACASDQHEPRTTTQWTVKDYFQVTGCLHQGIPPGGDFVLPSMIVNEAGKVIYRQAWSYARMLPDP